MKSDHPPFNRIQQAVAFFKPGNDSLDGIVEVVHCYCRAVSPGRKKRRLIDQSGQIRAGEARCQRRDLFRLHIGIEFYLFHMHCQDLLATQLVWSIDQNLAIEPASP